VGGSTSRRGGKEATPLGSVGARLVQSEQAFKNLFVRGIGAPPIRLRDGLIKRAVSVAEPGEGFVVLRRAAWLRVTLET